MTLMRDALARVASWPIQAAARSDGSDASTNPGCVSEGQMKARQGRLAEGEADVRRALAQQAQGGRQVSSEHRADQQSSVARLLTEQARFAEAEQLARSAVEIYRTLGYPEEAPVHASALNQLAITLFAAAPVRRGG